MGTIEGLTKARMLEIEGNSVVSGAIDVDTGHLILTQHDGDTIDAGKTRPDTFLDASETNKGVTTLATQAEVNTGTNATEIVTPATLKGKFTERQASQAEVNTGTEAAKFVTPATLAGRTATVTRAGVVELATLTEAATGTDTDRAITPEGLRAERDKIVTYGGVISPTWSSGLAPVTLNAGTPLSGTVVMCLLPKDNPGIQPGDSVIVSRTYTGAWYIVQSYAQGPKFMKQIPITLANGWTLYSDPVGTDTFHHFGEGPAEFGGAWIAPNSAKAGKAYLTCTTTGIVMINGLLAKPTAMVSNEVIATYPIEFAPARNQVFLTSCASGAGNIAVCTDGTIRSLFGASGYYSLQGLRWRTAASVTAGTATFTAIPLNAGFVALTSAAWGGEPGSTVHTPGYTVDADKVFIFEGMVASLAGAASGVNVSQLTALTPALTAHYGACMTGTGFGMLRIGASAGAAGAGNYLNIGVALGAGQAMSLSNMLWLDSTSTTTQRLSNVGGVNSWVAYALGSYSPPTFAKTPDGMCIAFGLWAGGTIGLGMTNMPPGWRPRFSSILAACSNALFARLDIGAISTGVGTEPQYSVLPNTGSNFWFSVDGSSWPAYK